MLMLLAFLQLASGLHPAYTTCYCLRLCCDSQRTNFRTASKSMSDFMRLPSGPPRRGRCGGGGRGRNQWQTRGGGRGRGGRGGRGRRQGSRHDNREFTDEIEELGTRSDDTTLCVAIQGCCHGELDAIYDRLKRYEESNGQKVDVLLCCGDFQSLRNTADYRSLAVPPKYRSLGSFHRYYSGEKEAPILTVFIGGNHEASQPLQELYYGGWVAPNIYYLGAAGVVNVAGVRIGGISGIYKSHDYTQGRFERPPYDRSSLRSVYHVRNADVYRLKCLLPENRIEIMLSHDWPQGIEQHGDTDKLLHQKPFFRDEVQRNDLGSPPNRELLDTLKPKWWFSAHLHVKFKAQVHHTPPAPDEGARDDSLASSLIPSQVHRTTTKQNNGEEGPADDGGGKPNANEAKHDASAVTTHFQSLESSKTCNEPDLTDLMTQFLALDKCLPRRIHLSIVHVPCHGRKGVLEYDPEWLAVLQKTHYLTCAERRRTHCPRELVHVTEEDIQSIRERLVGWGQDSETPLAIPQNFSITVPPHASHGSTTPLPMMGNPQTDDILNLLGLDHVITVPYNAGPSNVSIPAQMQFQQDDNEIDLEEDDDDHQGQDGGIVLDYEGAAPTQTAVADDNEIDLDDEDDGQSDANSDAGELPAQKKARANS